MKHFTRIHAVAAVSAALLLSPQLAHAKGDKQHKHMQQSGQMGKSGQGSQGGEQQLKGTVSQTGKAKPAGQGLSSNTIVLLETQEGDRIAVDLGRSSDLRDVQIKQGTPLTVKGSVVNIQGKPTFLASTVRVGGQDRQVERDMPQGQQQMGQRQQRQGGQMGQAMSQSGSRQFTGKIDKLRQVNVKNADQQHTVAILRQRDGRRVYIDLGPKDELQDANLSKGDQITVIGSGTRTREGHAVLQASRLMTKGQTFFIEREGQQTGDQQSKQRQKKQMQQRQQQMQGGGGQEQGGNQQQ